MQDQFKFRAFGLKSKQMHYWALLDCQSGWVSPDEETSDIMQCTGLKDKNGNLIFYGDIISGDWLFKPAVIEWLEDRASFGWVIKSIHDDGSLGGVFGILEDLLEHECEIIGNIYENPGLMEGK